MRKILISVFLFLLFGFSYSQNKDHPQIEIINALDEQYIGKIVYVSDSLIILVPNEESFDLQKLSKNARSLYFQEIKYVHIKRTSHFWKSVKIGAIIGGMVSAVILIVPSDDPYAGVGKLAGIGVVMPTSILIGGLVGGLKDRDDHFLIEGNPELFKRIYPVLRKVSIYPDHPPKEVITYLDQVKQQILSKRDSFQISESVRKPEYSPWQSKLHFSLGIGLSLTRADNDVAKVFDSAGFESEKSSTEGYNLPYNFNIGLAYSYSYKFQSYLEWCNMIRYEISGPWIESVDRSSLSLMIDYAIIPLDRLFINRFELLIGAGLSYNLLNVRRDTGIQAYELKENKLGLYIRGQFGYYLGKNLSMQFGLGGRLIPSIEVPELSNEDITVKSHKVNFSAIDIFFRLGFHF
jgi:hypothetical protein